MATLKEKALKVIAKQIKELDNNTLLLDNLNCPVGLGIVRKELFDILEANGVALTKDYNLFKK